MKRALLGIASAIVLAMGSAQAATATRAAFGALSDGTKLETVKSPLTTTGEQLTSLEDITHYNNFYEFGVEKGDPAKTTDLIQWLERNPSPKASLFQGVADSTVKPANRREDMP